MRTPWHTVAPRVKNSPTVSSGRTAKQSSTAYGGPPEFAIDAALDGARLDNDEARDGEPPADS